MRHGAAVVLFTLVALTARPVLQGATQTQRVRLVLSQGLPFSSGELVAAAALRVPLAVEGDPGALAVSIAKAGEDRIKIATSSRSREILLGGRAGADAARLVAVLMVDLIGP